MAAEFSSRNVDLFQPLMDNDDGLRGFEVKDADGYLFSSGGLVNDAPPKYPMTVAINGMLARDQANGISTSAKVPGAAAFTAATTFWTCGSISGQFPLPRTTIAILRVERFCWYRMFWSVVRSTSNPSS